MKMNENIEIKDKEKKIVVNIQLTEIMSDNNQRTINLEPVAGNKLRLSITAQYSEWNRNKWTDVAVEQILNYLLKFSGELGSKKENDALCELYDIWGRWHLNDMRPGTEHQTLALYGFVYNHAHPKMFSDYEQRCEWLKRYKMYEDRGFTYGKAWLYEPIPDSVISRLKEVIAVLKGSQ